MYKIYISTEETITYTHPCIHKEKKKTYGTPRQLSNTGRGSRGDGTQGEEA